MKKGLIWSAYDKTGENPSCLLVKGGGWQTSVGEPSAVVCRAIRRARATGRNAPQTRELKRRDGALNPAGEAAMAKLLQHGSRHPGQPASVVNNSCPQICPLTKRRRRIVAEWIVDEDQCFSAASTTGFKAMMSTATNCSYDGCYSKTVQGHVVAMGMEGKEECTAFHRELLGQYQASCIGRPLVKEWNCVLVSHGIRAHQRPRKTVQWR